MKYTKRICLLTGVALISCALICGCGARGEQSPAVSATIPIVGDMKNPSDYTWAEYQAMTEEQKLEFQKKFGSMEVFEAWKEKAQRENTREEQPILPWENGGKQPGDYTWAEFDELSGEQQIAFQNVLGAEAFEAWLNQAKNQSEEVPWDKPGAKQPGEYTWAEFDALTAEQQIIFQNKLGAEAFEAWLNQAKNQFEEAPWDKPGAKQPGEYTWAEFEALSAEQQMDFQNKLGAEDFEAWMNQVQNESVHNPWGKPGAKQPGDYTWEEFEKLTAEQQMAFQYVLGEDTFEEWMNQAQSQQMEAPWHKPGAKQPGDYTWAEFEALTAEQQIIFQNELGVEAFEGWLIRVNP